MYSYQQQWNNMNGYPQSWNNWYYRNPAFQPYYPAGQQVYSNPLYGWNYHNYAQGTYNYSNPYTHSYGYGGYTGNGAPNASSFNVADLQKTVINYFQDEEGQLDLDKMMSTTGQVMKTVQQVSPLVKGIGSFVKGIK
ncbi:YppG family protein [Halobacillus yeomjeoni]|uniref:YppG-like protein n=1 Tax=Halobacillus yeomjeoni TaxID=311194 RepID=A0A931HY48_9BACI|nr:YppG family protein [Halobacillus yeomjeoni]MBH0231574.1 hypothetical protein [Halobacillus yeomjeoni]